MAAPVNYVPIDKVRPADALGNPIGAYWSITPAPTKSDWVKQNIHSKDSGRLESGRAIVDRIGQADRLELEWQFITRLEGKAILQAFNRTFFLLTYLNAVEGDWVERHFYSGDMASNGYIPHADTWGSVSFAVIRITPDP